MGEIAEMMLEGLLCEGCGVCIDEGAPGHPRKCSDCARDTAKQPKQPPKKKGRKR